MLRTSLRFKKRWPVGTRERLIFDLGLYTGAARSDLAKLGRKNIKGDLLIYERQKSKVKARVPLTAELAGRDRPHTRHCAFFHSDRTRQAVQKRQALAMNLAMRHARQE